jgi:hypothetical protein
MHFKKLDLLKQRIRISALTSEVRFRWKYDWSNTKRFFVIHALVYLLLTPIIVVTLLGGINIVIIFFGCGLVVAITGSLLSGHYFKWAASFGVAANSGTLFAIPMFLWVILVKTVVDFTTGQ